MDPKVRHIWWTLRLGLGAIALLAGLDKFTNLMTYWPMYVSDTFAQLLPVSAQQFMYAVGGIEAAVGLAILIGFTRIGGYILAVWMSCIAVNLVTAGLYDLASRDVVIALTGLSLAKLTEALRHAPGEPSRSRAIGPGALHPAR